MQTYSTIKGKSNSDDGITRLVEHIVFERQTTSDDGFDSFPAYSRPTAQDYDDVSDSKSEDEEEEKDENFHSCDSEIQSFEDAESHHSGPEGPKSLPVAGTPNAQTPQKKKRRRPKTKNRKSKGKTSQTDKVMSGEGQEVDIPKSPEFQKQERVKGKGGIGLEEAMKLSTEDLMAAMELLNLWKEGSGRGK